MSGSRRERQRDTVRDLSFDRKPRVRRVGAKRHVRRLEHTHHRGGLGHSHLERVNPPAASRLAMTKLHNRAVVQDDTACRAS
jgi:hypothetical protein